MRFSYWFLSLAACAASAAAAPVSYTMAFTGGLFSHGVFVPLAPESGSFTYDPNAGFSNFLVDYDGDVFNLTASANAPSVCASPGNCTVGTPANELQMLTTGDNWSALEPVADGGATTSLSIGNFPAGISADAPHLPGFGIGSPPRTGTYALTASTPEPGTVQLLALASLGLLCFARILKRFV